MRALHLQNKTSWTTLSSAERAFHASLYCAQTLKQERTDFMRTPHHLALVWRVATFTILYADNIYLRLPRHLQPRFHMTEDDRKINCLKAFWFDTWSCKAAWWLRSHEMFSTCLCSKWENVLRMAEHGHHSRRHFHCTGRIHQWCAETKR